MLFQSTHPRGVRLHAERGIHGAERFQSTHPRGVRLLRCISCSCSIWVSIHAPTRGATCLNTTSEPINLFQSTHPRGVRHLQAQRCSRPKKFQSTHPRGVRQPTGSVESSENNVFQSTHPRGVRHEVPFQALVVDDVSIHAPTRGATLSAPCTRRLLACFNPRTHAGCDFSESSGVAPSVRFNPRTHAGCDQVPAETERVRPVSIHAPTRGATSMDSFEKVRVTFQSTHPRGVRRQWIHLKK